MKELNLEELKLAAKKLGYKLVRDPGPVPKRLPCLCGCTKVDKVIIKPGRVHMICRSCKRGIAVSSTDIRKKNLAWNTWVELKKRESPKCVRTGIMPISSVRHSNETRSSRSLT